MDRKAKIERVRKTGRISEARVRIADGYAKSPFYELKLRRIARMTETGDFTSLELVPVAALSAKLPAFRSRYDRVTEKVDTDILLDKIRTLNASAKRRVGRDFKAERRSYSGHQACSVNPPREYTLKLQLSLEDFPAMSEPGVVFNGRVLLDRLVFENNVAAALPGVSARASAYVGAADKERDRKTGP